MPSGLLAFRWDSAQKETLTVAANAEHSILFKVMTHPYQDRDGLFCYDLMPAIVLDHPEVTEKFRQGALFPSDD